MIRIVSLDDRSEVRRLPEEIQKLLDSSVIAEARIAPIFELSDTKLHYVWPLKF